MRTQHFQHLLRTLAAFFLVAMATACSDEGGGGGAGEPVPPVVIPGGIPVDFTADIASGGDSTRTIPGSRTILTPDNAGGFTVEWKGKDNYAEGCDKILIWATDAQGQGINGGNAKTYLPMTSAVKSALEPDGENNKITLPTEGDWTFTAVNGAVTVGNLTAYAAVSPMAQSAPGTTGHIAARDFSVATATQRVTAGGMPQVSFRFEHLLAALQLHVTNQTGNPVSVKEIRLSSEEGSMNIQDIYDVAQKKLAIAPLTAPYQQLTVTAPAPLANGGTAAHDFHMLLFPGYDALTMTITVITDIGVFTLSKMAPNGGFAAGTNYTVDVTLRSSGLADNETWTEYISTVDQFKAFRDRVNSGTPVLNALLTADIDLGQDAWTPIGQSGSSFQGTFDGGGHHISNLKTDLKDVLYNGLFGLVDGGTVRNLRVSGSIKTGERTNPKLSSYTGGIIGAVLHGTVENCIFSGDVNAQTSKCGGIAGCALDTRITGCYTKGSIASTKDAAGRVGGNEVGGIIGTCRYISQAGNCVIEHCYSESTITGQQYSGGIIGENSVNSYTSTVQNCYATGVVNAKDMAGGICVGAEGVATSCLALNPSLGRSSGSATSFGRISPSGTNTNCAAFSGMALPEGVTVTSDANGMHGADLTAAECLSQSTYTSRGFSGTRWSYDKASGWTWLPWNKAFESFPGIQPEDYRIAVPQHLKTTP